MMDAIDGKFLVSPDLFEQEADYLLGRCLPLLDILTDNEQAKQLRKDIVAYALQAGGAE